MSTPIRPFVERILGGRLVDVLVDCRADGMSFERISRHLADVHNIDVTGEVVRRWCIDSDVDQLVAARSTGAAS